MKSRCLTLLLMCMMLVACSNASPAPTPVLIPPATPAPGAAVSSETATAVPIETEKPVPPETGNAAAPVGAPVGAPLAVGPVAPPIESATWLNTQPIAWNSLRGMVALVEFWTFDCINCRHVLPYLRVMYSDYKDRGFTVLGIHSPEFDYEHELKNVQKAVQDMGIEYPVAIDNDFANWNRYHNLYWPAMYLVDKKGVIRFTHIGEGGDEEMRQWIEKLLAE